MSDSDDREVEDLTVNVWRPDALEPETDGPDGIDDIDDIHDIDDDVTVWRSDLDFAEATEIAAAADNVDDAGSEPVRVVPANPAEDVTVVAWRVEDPETGSEDSTETDLVAPAEAVVEEQVPQVGAESGVGDVEVVADVETSAVGDVEVMDPEPAPEGDVAGIGSTGADELDVAAVPFELDEVPVDDTDISFEPMPSVSTEGASSGEPVGDDFGFPDLAPTPGAERQQLDEAGLWSPGTRLNAGVRRPVRHQEATLPPQRRSWWIAATIVLAAMVVALALLAAAIWFQQSRDDGDPAVDEAASVVVGELASAQLLVAR